MRFATRTFLWSFFPVALLLSGSFWAIDHLVESRVRDSLRRSLREADATLAMMRQKSELQNSRFLRVLGENATLKAGMQLLLANRHSTPARTTMEEQLRETCETMGFDMLFVADADRHPLAGVVRVDGALVAMDLRSMTPPQQGFWEFGKRTFQIAPVVVNQGDENLGSLSVGEYFDLTDFTTPAVLMRNGKVRKSNVPGVTPGELEAALASCRDNTECDIRLKDENYITLPADSIRFGDGAILQTLQNVDTATGPVQTILRRVFVAAGLGAILVALVMSMFSSRSIVEPLAGVVATLRSSEQTGVLPEFSTSRSPVHEIRELAESFNRAGLAIREARAKLQAAYVEFVESLASALDARDRYTAGHSRRVSEYSCTIAEAMGLEAGALEEIRIGALLHDFGKVGVPDSILRKPGRLTPEEFALLQQHPTIGRRILEGVQGFSTYLPIVELHHENWDGSGYPLGLSGEKTPLVARIVHVADAWDAMTSDRPYRSGLAFEDALRELEKHAGAQFDPAVVSAFTQLEMIVKRRRGNEGGPPTKLRIV